MSRWIIVTQIFWCYYGWIAYCEIAQPEKKKISVLHRLKLINDSYKYIIDFSKRLLKNANERGLCV